MIDDDDLGREVLELMLSSEGHTVQLASSGDAALGELAGAKDGPEVILMDMQMPGLCGAELTCRLRELCGPGTRVIAMSGSRPNESELAGADAFLLKPFAVAEFDGVLEGAAANAQTERDAEDVLDEAVFASLQAMMGAASVRQLYELCLGDATQRFHAMEAAASEGDEDGLRKAAHSIKGSLGMVGARELQRLCATLERTGLADDHMATLQEFPAAAARLQRMLIARGVALEAVDPGA